MTPEQLPAVAPRVSFRNGVLTVDAENSTLGAVLNAIRRQTGAQIDVPPTGANQRVAAHLSGTPREVIASLLDGSELGYAIVGAPDNPERVQQVILMTQSRNGGEFPANGNPGPGMNPAPGMNAAPPSGQPPMESEPDLAPADEGPTPEQMNERFPQQSNQQEPPPGQQPVNGMSQNGMPPNPPQSPEQQQMQNNGAQGKTPEQLLQELQRMRNKRYPAQQ
jgi:hypothetical protein